MAGKPGNRKRSSGWTELNCWVRKWLHRLFNMFCNPVGIRYFIEMMGCFAAVAVHVIVENSNIADAYRL